MKKHIHMVDDEPAILQILQMNFEHAGYRVTTSNNGLATICALMEPKLPDLVIVGDLSPRPETSLCLVSDIKDAATGQQMPIIMLSTQSTHDDIRCGLASGADRYVTKPFSPSRLLILVDELITKRAA